MTRPAKSAATGAIGFSGDALAGRHALVTGGGSGIGAAVAQALAAAGARVTLVGRRVEALRATAEGLPAAASHGIAAADVTDAAALQSALDKAATERGAIDILVNCAGQAASAPMLKSDAALWRAMLDVNLMGVVHATQAALPAMQTQGWGRIVNVASTAGLVGYAYVSAYCAAKHAVLGLTRSLALEVATRGVTVNAVCPGYTDTPLLAAAVANIRAKTGRSEAQALAELEAGNPQQRLVTPQEVAATVLWLCLPSSSAINGQAIAVAGGEVMTG